MAIVVNTNVTSLMVQKNLTSANTAVSKTTERLSTGYKINRAADDAAGLAISEGMVSQINGTSIAEDNTQHGINLLQTAESDMSVIQDHLQRIRDLTVQAANGTYSTSERQMLKEEVVSRFNEITRLANVSQFSDINLLNSNDTTGLVLQVGANSGVDNRLDISDALAKLTATALNAQFGAAGIDAAYATSQASSDFIDVVDDAISYVSDLRSKIGAYQNRLESTIESLEIKNENLSSSLSTLRDADIAKEAAELTKQQILQQSSATLLAQANANPQIALSLIS